MGFTASGFQSKGTKTVVNITAFKVLLAAMAVMPKSKKQLHEITGLTDTTISRWMRVLSSGKDRIVYIADWKRFSTRGDYTAMWAMGYGMADAPKPKALTMSEYNKRWRATQEKKATTIDKSTPGVLIHSTNVHTDRNRVGYRDYNSKEYLQSRKLAKSKETS